ncbi:TM0106 family RecB-like putative nuclease [Kamptonema animale CS-326]|jgi:predicted RecB family nuclease|uniref:TM0106 family RecB-like putative nuclease n=1 Tax=Kamptonema animale TaxID=92934 RepID=UPI00232C7B1C|nr:TM0106 family RecB-like putative nuclease [Kamptonema animale]MDB9513804.1 TM0106 family RecB-like putative nuclease [Kamptonema animale CS-326]
MLITDKQLLNYQRCNRRAFLDAYGDINQLDPASDFLLKLIRDSLTYRQTIVEQQAYHQPYYPHGDWVAGTEATLSLMRQGVDRIYRGVLLQHEKSENLSESIENSEVSNIVNSSFLPSNIALLSRPHLLVKQPGDSDLGDWMYAPADIWIAKRPKLDYQIVSAFHAQVLASAQGVMPDTAWLILREKGPYAVNLWQRLPQMQEILKHCIQMFEEKNDPEMFISRQKCNLCRWYTSCYGIAESKKHLSLLPGVTPARYAQLQNLNLTTVESLALANPELLINYREFEGGIAAQLVQQAQSKLQNQAMIRNLNAENGSSENLSPNSPFLTPTSQISRSNYPPNFLTTTPVEIYFDLEAEPELNLDYLQGVLVVDRSKNTKTYHALLAEIPADEGLIWQQFLDLVWSYPIAPIFHFCDYEIQTVKRLARRYKTPAYQWQPVLKRFVDIHKQVTQTVILPVDSYALKPIARWMGFEWRDAKANGAQCVCWYDEWLKTGDRAFLDAIVRYNEDDCRATYHVKDWLASFLQNI